MRVDVQVSNANFSHVSSAAKVISSAAVDQKQIIAVVVESGQQIGLSLFLVCCTVHITYRPTGKKMRKT